MESTMASWWQLKYFWNFHPDPWGNDEIWRAYFSNGLVQPPTSIFWFLTPIPAEMMQFDLGIFLRWVVSKITNYKEMWWWWISKWNRFQQKFGLKIWYPIRIRFPPRKMAVMLRFSKTPLLTIQVPTLPPTSEKHLLRLDIFGAPQKTHTSRGPNLGMDIWRAV